MHRTIRLHRADGPSPSDDMVLGPDAPGFAPSRCRPDGARRGRHELEIAGRGAGVGSGPHGRLCVRGSTRPSEEGEDAGECGQVGMGRINDAFEAEPHGVPGVGDKECPLPGGVDLLVHCGAAGEEVSARPQDEAEGGAPPALSLGPPLGLQCGHKVWRCRPHGHRG